MTILFINGSPRREGHISQILAAMRSEAESAGHKVIDVNVYSLSVAPCRGCMQCRSARRCALPADDAVRVAALLAQADALVIGAPCYWGNMPGQLKLLFDRLVYALMDDCAPGLPRPLHKGKRAVIISTCTTAFPFNILFKQSRGAIHAVREVLRWSGFRVTGTMEKGGTRSHTGLTEGELRRCRRLIRKL